jgi:hypothetical protein
MSLWEKIPPLVGLVPPWDQMLRNVTVGKNPVVRGFMPPHRRRRATRLRPRGTGNHSKLHISASSPKLQNPPPPAWSCCSQLPLSGQQSPRKLHRRTQSPLIAMPTSPLPHTHARKSQPTRASSPLQRYTAHRRGSSEAVSGLGGRRAKKTPSLRLATAPSGALAEPPKRGKVRLAPHAQRRARKHARRVLACCNAPSPAPRHHRRPRFGISEHPPPLTSTVSVALNCTPLRLSRALQGAWP